MTAETGIAYSGLIEQIRHSGDTKRVTVSVDAHTVCVYRTKQRLPDAVGRSVEVKGRVAYTAPRSDGRTEIRLRGAVTALGALDAAWCQRQRERAADALRALATALDGDDTTSRYRRARLLPLLERLTRLE